MFVERKNGSVMLSGVEVWRGFTDVNIPTSFQEVKAWQYSGDDRDCRALFYETLSSKNNERKNGCHSREGGNPRW
jgi:hypothetical protein